jgi:excisionase family DNA binding protein
MSSLEKLLYSMDEGAETLAISRAKFMKLVHAGAITTVMIGARRLVSRRALEEYVAALLRRQ